MTDSSKIVCLTEDLTWRVNNLCGHMKQLYKNVKNISGLKTEYFNFLLQHFLAFCLMVSLKLGSSSTDTSQA